jgi:hypothetical protein
MWQVLVTDPRVLQVHQCFTDSPKLFRAATDCRFVQRVWFHLESSHCEWNASTQSVFRNAAAPSFTAARAEYH